MKTKFIILILLSVLSTSILAKGGSFGGRAGGFGSRSSSSVKTSSVSKPSSYSFGSTSTSKSPSNSKLYTQFKEKYSTPSKNVVEQDIKQIFNRDYRTQRKKDFYSNYHVPSYAQPVIMQQPSYGIYDSLMMWSLLDNMGDRHMYYHHQDDPAFVQWRNDADKLCKEGNTEICEKLNSLDNDVAELKNKGIKKDVSYITDGVDPNIYISPAGIDVETLKSIKICTGTASSDYSRFAKYISDKTKLKIELIPTNGSIDNLTKLSQGYCDMTFAQSDTIVSDELVKAMQLSKQESTLLVCNKESKYKSSNDINKNTTIYVGSDQTGSQFTLNSISSKIDSFKSAKIDNTKSTVEASLLIGENKDTCLFAVDTWDAPYIKQLDNEGKSKLITIDVNLPNYNQSYLEKSKYTNLNNVESWWRMFLFGGTKVLTVTPVLVTTKTWIAQNAIVYYDVLMLNRQTLSTNIK